MGDSFHSTYQSITRKLKMNQTPLQWIDQVSSTNPFLLHLLFFLFVLLAITFRKDGAIKYKLPPSPYKLPFIGNMHQLHGSPHHALWSLALKHGPLMLLHLGRVPTLVVSSADIAQDVMKTYDNVFSSRPGFMIPKRLLYAKDIAVVPYGEYWRQVRKICVLQLLSFKKVQSFRFVREEEVDLMLEKIKEFCLSSSMVNLSEMFTSLTNNTVCRIALGRKYSEDESGRKFKEILKEFNYLLGVSNVGDLLPSLAWLNHLNGLNTRVEKNFRDIDSILDDAVQEHIEKKLKNGGGEYEEDDFVDLLLATEKDSALGIPMERDNTKAIILDMFAAGTDTVSVLMEWTMSELIRHPEIMKEVQKEVRNVAKGELLLNENQMEELHILKSVIKETLRLHPPLPLLTFRLSMKDAKLQGYDVPAKTMVIINAFAIGRDPLYWEEPEKFWPKRFLSGSSASVDYKGQDFCLIPFGAGRRGCPGINFATSVVELCLANLLNMFDWALGNGMDGKSLDMEEDPGLAVHRKSDLVLAAKLHYESV